jgi:type IV secretory pathway TraG/TraD family ATPase VirD4
MNWFLYSRLMLLLFPHLREAIHRHAFPLGGVMLPEEELHRNFLAINGGTGAAKSLILTLHLAHRVPYIIPGSRRRMVLYDYKNELPRRIAALEPGAPTSILLPTDYRSARWELRRDIHTPKRAIQFSANMVPDVPGEQNPYFTLAVRNLLEGVLLVLIELYADLWSLADLLRILENEHYTRETLQKTAMARSKLRFLKNQEVWNNIESTIETKLNPLKIVASYWLHAKEAVSIREFIDGEAIYLLGFDPELAVVIQVLNNLFLQCLSETLLGRPDGTTGITDVVIDEATTLNGLNMSAFLREVAQRGRARGLNATIVYQSYGDWKAIMKELTNGFLGQFRNQIYLGTGDIDTAKYNSEMMGRERGRERRTSKTHGHGTQGTSVTEGYEWFDRELVPYAEFLRLLPSSEQNGIHGFACNPSLGAWPFHLSGAWVARHVVPPHPDVPGLIERPEWQQYLPPFNEADRARLGLTPPPDPES